MNFKSRRFIITLLAILIFIIFAIFALVFISNESSKITVSINYQHSKDLELYEVTSLESKLFISNINQQGQQFKLDKSKKYLILYKGTDGYSDGYKYFDNTVNVDIKPAFSDKKINTIIEESSQDIDQLIVSKYPNVKSYYDIKPATILENGEWCVVILVYNKEYDYNADNLIMLFKKQGEGWSVATKPQIILTTHDYPTIPLDILRKANLFKLSSFSEA